MLATTLEIFCVILMLSIILLNRLFIVLWVN